MALVSDIQLQPSAVKPPNLDTSKKFSAEGLTATTAFAVTDGGAGTTVSTSGLITAKSSNDVRNWFQSTKADGNVELYMSNDARPDWALRVSGTADNAFIIANSYGSNCTAQFPAFSIGGAGAVGIGKTGATNALDIAYKNSTTGGIQITETQNNVGVKVIAESAAGFIGTSSNHKLGFRVNNSTVGLFNTSGQLGIGTDSPGATLDVRGGAVFNEAGAAVDFRIEGDANQNLFFVDGSADAIGMGTATPVDTSTLHIMGTDGDPSATHNADAMLIVENNGNTVIEIATSNTTYGGIGFSDAGAHSRGAVIYDHGTGLGGLADTLMFQTAGSIGMVLDSGGEVGIGTLQPSSMLHVVGGSDAAIRLQGSDTGSPALNFFQGTTCRGTVAYQDTNDVFAIDSAGDIQLQTSSTPKLVIANAGCVGIGTNAIATACNAQLDIFSAGATTALQLRSGNTSAASATIRGEGYRANGDSEQVLQVVGRNKNALIDLGIFEVSAEAKHCLGALEFKTFDGSSMSTKMKISSGGCVGIGTNAPTDIFHVRLGSNLNWKFGYPSNSVTTLAALNDAESAYVTARIDAGTLELNSQSGGNVGIGTTIMCHRLDINESTGCLLRLRGCDDFNYDLTSKTNGYHFDHHIGSSNAIFSWSDSAAEMMRIDQTGLGIGTASPGGRLHVQGGNIAVDSSSRKIGYITDATAANTGYLIPYDGSGFLSLHSNFATGGIKLHTGTANTERVRINASGNVGIGTTSPQTSLQIIDTGTNPKIHVGHASADLQGYRLEFSHTQQTGGIDFTTSSPHANLDLYAGGSPTNSGGWCGQIRFFTGLANSAGTERVRITSAGNVGIGTTAPSALLDVFGGTAHIKGTGGGCIQLVRNDGTGTSGEFLGVLDFVSTDASTGSCGTMARVASSYDSAGDSAKIHFVTGTSTGSGTPTLTERMTILSGGNVGIGTTVICDNGSNSRVLQVRATTGAGTLHLTNDNTGSTASDGAIISESGTDMFLINRESGNMYLRTADTNRIIIDPSGRIGIGTIAPLTNCGPTLYVNGTENNCEVLRVGQDPGASGSTQGTTYIGLSAFNSGTHAHGRIGVVEASVGSFQGHMIFETRGTDGDNLPSERMRITSSGLVGIGTNNPANQLHVKTSSGFQVAIMEGGIQTFLYADTAFWGFGDATAYGGNLWGGHKSNCELYARTAGVQQMMVDSSGRVAIGENVSPRGTAFFEGGHSAALQIEGTTVSNSGISMIRNNANFGPNLILARSCGTSRGSNTLVAHSQSIGGISFQANDGTDFVTAATIGAKVGCAAASNCMSGELQFWTNCGSDGGIVERMRLQQFGDLQIGAPYGECDSKFIICQQTSTKAAMRLQQSNSDQVVEIMTTANASYASIMSNITSVRAAGSDHDYMRMNSDGGTDVEFRFRGDGNAFADAAFNNSGADYQEYFESTSGVAAEVGRVVVLDNDKVRYYNSTTDNTDDIMGVTRPEADNKNSAVVGNVAWNFWTDKYLTDDWGVYLREDVNVWSWTDDDGGEHGVYERDEIAKDPTWTPPTGAVMTVQSIRKKNPEYNESLSENYQSRADRDEWWLIGLLGQIQVKAGEPVNSRWIKMKDISDAVELYYVR